MSKFFEPWVGEKYEDGINFDHDKIKSGNRKDPDNKAKGFYKVMVLGKEHFCDYEKNPKQIEDRNLDQQQYIKLLQQIINIQSNNSPSSYIDKQLKYLLLEAKKYSSCNICTSPNDCEKLTVCKYKTINVIEEICIKNKEKHASDKNFHNEFSPEDSPIDTWNSLLFANFFQRGMPYSDTGRNDQFHGIDEKKCGAVALADIIIEHTPDIIISWGKDDTHVNILIDNPEILQKKNIYLRRMPNPQGENYKIPRIHIDPVKDNRYIIPFTILDLKDDNGNIKSSCLFVFLPHPSYEKQKGIVNNKKNIRCFFKHYKDLIKWDPVKNEKILKRPYPITCKFDESLNWKTQQDEADFIKCT